MDIWCCVFICKIWRKSAILPKLSGLLGPKYEKYFLSSLKKYTNWEKISCLNFYIFEGMRGNIFHIFWALFWSSVHVFFFFKFSFHLVTESYWFIRFQFGLPLFQCSLKSTGPHIRKQCKKNALYIIIKCLVISFLRNPI